MPTNPNQLGREIRTAIIVDIMGASDKEPEDEIRELTEIYSEYVAPDTLKIHTPMVPYQIEPGTELVLFDFGGFMPGSEDTVMSNVRSMIKWAEEHPSGLVLVVSSFTFTRYIKDEMEDRGLSLPNMLESNSDDPIPEWWLGRPVRRFQPTGKLKSPGTPSLRGDD